MAITRAQQVKQMLQDGGRIGLQSGSFMDSGEVRESRRTQTTKSSPRERGITLSQNQNKDRTRTIDDLTPKEISPPERDTGLEKIRERNIDIRDNIGSGITQVPDIIPGSTALNFLQNLLSNQAIKNRQFALDASMKNRAFFRNNPLLAGGKTIYDLTEDEREDLIDQYYDARSSNLIDATGNIIGGYIGPDGQIIKTGRDDNQILFPENIIPSDPNQDPDDNEEEDPNRFFRLFAEGGSVDDVEREAMFLGGITKGIKKAVRGIKKIAKSPIGKAALIAGGAGFFGMGPFAGLAKTKVGIGLSNLFGKGSFNPLKQLVDSEGFTGLGPSNLAMKLAEFGLVNPSTMGLTGMGKFAALGIPAALAGVMTDKQEDEFKEPKYPEFNMRAYLSNPYAFTPTRQMADGGIMREGYQEGSKEPVAKKTMPLLDMDGKEMDFREEGGFVPIGRMEKADDVPARLSKNEFVFTADAVRNAGGGDVDKGAEVMYNMMKNLESGGEVSEESQGLEGAREMFQTSKRLEEVL